MHMKLKRNYPADSTHFQGIPCASLYFPNGLAPDRYLYTKPCAQTFTQSSCENGLNCIYNQIPRPYAFAVGTANAKIAGNHPNVILPLGLQEDAVGMYIFDESMLDDETTLTTSRTKSKEYFDPFWITDITTSEFNSFRPKAPTTKEIKIMAVLFNQQTKHIFFTVYTYFYPSLRRLYVKEVINYSTSRFRGYCTKIFDQLINYIYYHPLLSCNEVNLECLINERNQGRTLACYMRAIGTYFPVYYMPSTDDENLAQTEYRKLGEGKFKGSLGIALDTKGKEYKELENALYQTFKYTPKNPTWHTPQITWFRVYENGFMYVRRPRPQKKNIVTVKVSSPKSKSSTKKNKPRSLTKAPRLNKAPRAPRSPSRKAPRTPVNPLGWKGFNCYRF